MQNEKTEKSIYTNDHANSITDELSASDSSSDDDIIIDRTEETKDKSRIQVSEDSHMEIDNAQQNDDREYSMTLLLKPLRCRKYIVDITKIYIFIHEFKYHLSILLAWSSINDHTKPSEVAPIDMDTTANPWESAAAASSPTPGT